MESYFQVFLNSSLAKGNFLGFMTLFLLFLARILPIIGQSPFFGAKVLPHPVKIAFAFTLFVIFLPKLLLVTNTPLTYSYFTLLMLFKELLVGYILGFIMSIPFMIVSNAGVLIDQQRGGASLMVNDPTIQNQSSPLGTMFNYVLIYIFFLIDGPFLFMDAIMQSYDVVPPDQFINHEFFAKDSDFWTMEVKLLNVIMTISLRLAAPALLVILMTDVFLGIANRLAPQVQITFLGMPLKSLLALMIVCLGWKLFSEEMGKQGIYWVNQVIEVLRMLKPGTPLTPATTN